jgi:hypothetical protein
MIGIPLAFRLLSEVSVLDSLGQAGVYVIWDASCASRPAYIGQGLWLQRLLSHSRSPKFAPPLGGYIALTGRHMGSRKGRPRLRPPALSDHVSAGAMYLPSDLATMAEWALIQWASTRGIPPRHNQLAGELPRLREMVRAFGEARFHVLDLDPLIDPSAPRKLAQAVGLRVAGAGAELAFSLLDS